MVKFQNAFDSVIAYDLSGGDLVWLLEERIKMEEGTIM